MKWQREQIQLFHSAEKVVKDSLTDINPLNKVMYKITGSSSIFRLLPSGVAAFSKVIFMKIVKTKIENGYKKLGPVTGDGSRVNRPEFHRHLRALQCNCSGGDHEWEAV